MSGVPLRWTAVAQNRKTGPIPTAYVGSTRQETWDSCEGCELREGRCYAWRGPQLSFGLLKIQQRARERPENYVVEHALAARHRTARVARISAVGDPSRADRVELLRAIRMIREDGLGVLGYTHFWADPWNEHLRQHLLASCNDLEQADEALAAGWIPAAVLPPDTPHDGPPTFTTPGGARGVVCPAQRRDHVTCNTCGMCDPSHQVWKAGKVQLIGFFDHSRSSQRAARASGRPLPSAGVAGARAPVGWAP